MIVFLGVAFSKILTYTYRIIIARGFGPEHYGVFAIAMMIVGWFITFADLGFSNGLMRYLSLYRGQNRQNDSQYVFRYSLLVLGIPSILLGLVLFFGSDFIATSLFHNAELSMFLKLFSILVPVTIYGNIFLSALRAYEEIHWYSFIFNISQNVMKVVSLGLLILIGAGSLSVPISYVTGIVTILVIALYASKKTTGFLFNSPKKIAITKKKSLRREFTRYSISLLFFSIVAVIFYWIDTFSLGYLKGAEQVGLYNAAVPIVLLLGLAPELFMQLFLPLITKEFGRKKMSLVIQLTKQVTKWVFIINLPAFLLICVFPEAAINILFGAQYLPAAPALRILSFGGLISSVITVLNQLMMMIGKSKITLIDLSIASLINLILNFIFIPMNNILGIDNSSGIVGAALATVTSIIVLNTALVAQSKIYLNFIPFRRKMISIAISALIPFTIIWILHRYVPSGIISAIVLSILFFLMYLVLIFITKALDEHDLAIVKKLSSRIPVIGNRDYRTE